MAVGNTSPTLSLGLCGYEVLHAWDAQKYTGKTPRHIKEVGGKKRTQLAWCASLGAGGQVGSWVFQQCAISVVAKYISQAKKNYGRYLPEVQGKKQKTGKGMKLELM